jgi:branched-chain amino acid transport system permease protein
VTGSRSVLLLTGVSGLIMMVAAVGTRRFVTLTFVLGGIVVAIGLPLSPVADRLDPAMAALALMLAALGLVVLNGWAGQAFLAPLGFAGIGAYATAWLAGGAGLPLAAAVTLALATVVGVAALLIPLTTGGRQVEMAIVSLGLAQALQAAWFASPHLGGVRSVPSPVPQALVIRGYSILPDVALYFGLLTAVGVALLAMLVLQESGFRQSLSAVASGEAPAAARGVDVTSVTAAATLLGAGLCGAAGCALAVVSGQVSPGSFDAEASLRLVAAMVIVGRARIGGAIVAGALCGAVPALMERYQPVDWYRPQLLDLAIGAAAVVAVVGGTRLAAIVDRVRYMRLQSRRAPGVATAPAVGDLLPAAEPQARADSSSSSTMSRTTMRPSLPVDLAASSKSDTSNGQQTASVSAPVATASRMRTSARRSSTFSRR